MKIDRNISPQDIAGLLGKFWEISGHKIKSISETFDSSKGSPVFTVEGRYVTRGWTEWTMGFHFGSSILNYEAGGEPGFLELGRQGTVTKMPVNISHTGVHDHGFNNLSTFGNLLRLMNEGIIPENEWERNYYEIALKLSGAVQASRWTQLGTGGYIYSFNGPHSLFIDTLRSVRILMVSHLLGHDLMGEDDRRIDLLDRACEHLKTTAHYSVYYGKNRDHYDTPGRTVHECIFNVLNGSFRSPSSQQGYSGRTTWFRGLSWAMLGFTEELELINDLIGKKIKTHADLNEVRTILLTAARVTCDFYIENSALDGIPYWDSGAPGLKFIEDFRECPADPFNEFEPVDSSAAVIAAQALLRLGKYFEKSGEPEKSSRYFQAGLTVFRTLLAEPYLSEDLQHQGLILHSLYHRPNDWDYKPEKNKVPYGESSMWGDYHARELAVYVGKLINHEKYYTFYNCVK